MAVIDRNIHRDVILVNEEDLLFETYSRVVQGIFSKENYKDFISNINVNSISQPNLKEPKLYIYVGFANDKALHQYKQSTYNFSEKTTLYDPFNITFEFDMHTSIHYYIETTPKKLIDTLMYRRGHSFKEIMNALSRQDSKQMLVYALEITDEIEMKLYEKLTNSIKTRIPKPFESNYLLISFDDDIKTFFLKILQQLSVEELVIPTKEEYNQCVEYNKEFATYFTCTIRFKAISPTQPGSESHPIQIYNTPSNALPSLSKKVYFPEKLNYMYDLIRGIGSVYDETDINLFHRVPFTNSELNPQTKDPNAYLYITRNNAEESIASGLQLIEITPIRTLLFFKRNIPHIVQNISDFVLMNLGGYRKTGIFATSPDLDSKVLKRISDKNQEPRIVLGYSFERKEERWSRASDSETYHV